LSTYHCAPAVDRPAILLLYHGDARRGLEGEEGVHNRHVQLHIRKAHAGRVAEEVLDSYLNDPSAGYFALVAETDTAVAGYICFGITPLTEGTWDIYWIAVAREMQGKGIGAVLLTVAENKIKQVEGRLIFAETSSIPEYDKTRRFYLAQGYGVAAQIADFYVPGDDKVIFQKRLK